MTAALAVVGAALGGVVIGAAVGWPLGRRMRGSPTRWVGAMVLAFAGSCFAAYQAMASGRALLGDLWLGVAFGAMTGIKYGGGILPSLQADTTRTKPSEGDLGVESSVDDE